MGTITESILAFVTIILIVGIMYSVLEWQCKKSFNELKIGDQYLIVNRRNPRNYMVLTVTELDTNNGTVSYNLRKAKTDTVCYEEITADYKYFFLTSILSNNETYVEYLGNNTSHLKN